MVWFSATTPEHARELWRTAGTAAGTLLIDELGSGTEQAYRHGTAVPNGTLLMSSTSTATGTEPHAAAPGSTSLTLLVDLAPGVASSSPSRAAVIGNLGWFSTDGRANAGPWRTDGTPAGTVLDESLAGVPFVRLAAAAGKLWMIDGRIGSGTLRVKDGPGMATRKLVPSGGLVAHEVVGETNGRAVFVGETAANGIEPWVRDGIAAGTRLVRDLEPGASGSMPRGLVEHAGSG